MPGMSQRELVGFYRAHVPYVRGLLQRNGKRWGLQAADHDDVIQDVFRKVLTSWPSPRPLNERAYLTTMVVNQKNEQHRRYNKVTADRRLNVTMVAEEASGPVDVDLVDRVDVADEVGMARLRQNFEKIARALSPANAVVFRRMMIDVDDVPAKERNRVLAEVRKLIDLPTRPRSVEYPDLVEGPSHCGRTVRRLERERRAVDDSLDAQEADEELGAAE